MSGGTPRKPSYTRAASVLSTGSTDEDVAESQPAVQVKDDAKPLLGSTRKKLSLVVLCIVYFAANASFSVISPFFPGEVMITLGSMIEFKLRYLFSVSTFVITLTKFKVSDYVSMYDA